MKKILLFAVLFALCGAFTVAHFQKNEIVLAEPPPLEDRISDEEWTEYENTYKNEDKETAASFEKLLELFPKGNLPFTLTANTLREQYLALYDTSKAVRIERKPLAREFRKFFPALDNTSRFSRMPPPIGEPLMAFEAKGKHVLVYFSKRGGYNYYVTTFDAKGKLVSEKMMASAHHHELTEANLDQNLNLTQTKYTIVWEETKGDVYDYKNRKIKELKFVEKTNVSLLNEKEGEKEIEKTKEKKEKVVRADP